MRGWSQAGGSPWADSPARGNLRQENEGSHLVPANACCFCKYQAPAGAQQLVSSGPPTPWPLGLHCVDHGTPANPHFPPPNPDDHLSPGNSPVPPGSGPSLSRGPGHESVFAEAAGAGDCQVAVCPSVSSEVRELHVQEGCGRGRRGRDTPPVTLRAPVGGAGFPGTASCCSQPGGVYVGHLDIVLVAHHILYKPLWAHLARAAVYIGSRPSPVLAASGTRTAHPIVSFARSKHLFLLCADSTGWSAKINPKLGSHL